jgi:hypothetical protein
MYIENFLEQYTSQEKKKFLEDKKINNKKIKKI